LANESSNKRQVLGASRAVEDLERMQDLLKSPKKEALEPHIKVYEPYWIKSALGRPNDALADSLWHDLETQRRLIIREFWAERSEGVHLEGRGAHKADPDDRAVTAG